jgi:hypothetical protein
VDYNKEKIALKIQLLLSFIGLMISLYTHTPIYFTALFAFLVNVCLVALWFIKGIEDKKKGK